MRDAEVLEFCKQILNAETDQEIDEIMDEIPNTLREEGYSEQEIETLMMNLDKTLEQIENEQIIINEMGDVIAVQNNLEATIEGSVVEQSSPTPAVSILGGGIALTFTLAAVLVILKKKKKALIDNNEKSL